MTLIPIYYNEAKCSNCSQKQDIQLVSNQHFIPPKCIKCECQIIYLYEKKEKEKDKDKDIKWMIQVDNGIKW